MVRLLMEQYQNHLAELDLTLLQETIAAVLKLERIYRVQWR